jgi:hypothetical protein
VAACGAAKTRNNKIWCNKGCLQLAQLFADFLGASEKGSELIHETRGQWRVRAELARYGDIQGRKTTCYFNSIKHVHE